MLTPVKFPGLAAGLVTTIVIVEVPPDAIVEGAKLFATIGGL